MKEIVDKLHECGENVEIRRGHIHVKFPLFMSNLVIKKDIATNQLMFAYNQIGDLFSIVLFCLLAGNFIAKGEYIFGMFSIGIALVTAVTCISKEIRVAAIKQQINTLFKMNPHLQPIDSLTTEDI